MDNEAGPAGRWVIITFISLSLTLRYPVYRPGLCDTLQPCGIIKSHLTEEDTLCGKSRRS